MEKAQALTEVRRSFPEAVREAYSLLGEDILLTSRESLFRLAKGLQAEPWDYALLLDLTCVDYLASRGCLEMIYTLYSLSRNHRLRIKVEIPAGEPSLDSLTPLWKNADWLEREVFDMFGVRFEGHPYLKRIFLYDGFEGHPLRRDYPLRHRQPIIPPRKREP